MKIKSLRIALSALTISTFGLAACGGPGRSDYAESARPMAAPPPVEMSMSAKMANDGMYMEEMDAGGGPDGSAGGEAIAQQYIAYSHSLGMCLDRRARVLLEYRYCTSRSRGWLHPCVSVKVVLHLPQQCV